MLFRSPSSSTHPDAASTDAAGSAVKVSGVRAAIIAAVDNTAIIAIGFFIICSLLFCGWAVAQIPWLHYGCDYNLSFFKFLVKLISKTVSVRKGWKQTAGTGVKCCRGRGRQPVKMAYRIKIRNEIR